jgi:hypothetical protein
LLRRLDSAAGCRVNSGGTATRTAFQHLHLRFVEDFRDARSLGAREYYVLLDIVTLMVAQLDAASLDREERP